jgi:hypothetical protein
MTEEQATAIADALGGEAWQSGGDIWLVIVRRQDGHMVVLSDEVICEYENEEAFDEAKASTANLLTLSLGAPPFFIDCQHLLRL